MASISINFKDTKSGVSIRLDPPAAYKRVCRTGHKLSKAEELAARVFVTLQQTMDLLTAEAKRG